MRFTRRTYRAAIRRARKREARAWNDHRMALRGPHAWHDAIRTRKALEQRRIREQGKEQGRG